MSNDKNYAVIRPWLSVGNSDACKENFTHCIHIWRSDFQDHSCSDKPESSRLYTKHNFDYRFDYRDGESIPLASVVDIRDFIRNKFINGSQQKNLLVHCAAGMTRSPTIAILALCEVEKGNPLDYLSEVYKCLWNQRKIIGNVCHSPLKDLVNYYEGGVFK